MKWAGMLFRGKGRPMVDMTIVVIFGCRGRRVGGLGIKNDSRRNKMEIYMVVLFQTKECVSACCTEILQRESE